MQESLGKLPIHNVVVDGEIICVDEHGVSQFNALFCRRGKPVFYAFDLLWLNSEDLRSLPLIERKHRLRDLIQQSDCKEIIYAQHIEARGIAFFEEICQRDFGLDSRGVLENGESWRLVIVPDKEIVSYFEAVPETAQIFDSIIDSACFQPGAPTR